jgi:hypothetical protein
VPDSPDAADERGAQEAALFADDCRDGDDVINFGRVLEAEDQPQAQDRQRAE